MQCPDGYLPRRVLKHATCGTDRSAYSCMAVRDVRYSPRMFSTGLGTCCYAAAYGTELRAKLYQSVGPGTRWEVATIVERWNKPARYKMHRPESNANEHALGTHAAYGPTGMFWYSVWSSWDDVVLTWRMEDMKKTQALQQKRAKEEYPKLPVRAYAYHAIG
eukprot:2313909-Rhodomonas_salina.2